MGIYYNFMYLLGVFLVGPIRGFLITTNRTSRHIPVGEIIGYSRSFLVRGTRRVALNFLGIPYAEAPIGPRRFRKPVPQAAFTSPFDASKFGSPCYRFEGKHIIINTITYSEDCLTLNVFTPEPSNNGRLFPVIVKIPGGGYDMGSAYGFEDGMYSVTGDVIMRYSQFQVKWVRILK